MESFKRKKVNYTKENIINTKYYKIIEEIEESCFFSKIDLYEFLEYNEDCYICDMITEVSDNNIDIYYYNLFDWAKNNFSIIEESNNELGVINDITKQIQQAQYYLNSNECYDNLNDIIKYIAINYLKDNYIYLKDEQLDLLYDRLDIIDNNNKIEEIYNIINELIEEQKEGLKNE